MKRGVYFFPVLVLWLCGCAGVIMKPAEVTPKGKFHIGLAMSGGAVKLPEEIFGTTDWKWQPVYVPGLYGRYGILENTELGLEILGARTHLEVRHQFFEAPIISAGLGLGVFSSYLGLYLGAKRQGVLPYLGYRLHIGHFGLGAYHTFAGGIHLMHEQPFSFILEASYSPSMKTVFEDEELVSGFMVSAGINIRP